MTKRGPGPGQRGAAVGQGPGAGGRGASRGRLLPLEAKSLVGSVHLSVSAEQPDGAEVLRIPPGRRGQRHGRCHDPDRTRGQDPQRQELEGCQDHDGQGGHLPGLLEKVRQGAHPRGLPQSLQVSRGPAAPGPVPFSPRWECVVLNPRPRGPKGAPVLTGTGGRGSWAAQSKLGPQRQWPAAWAHLPAPELPRGRGGARSPAHGEPCRPLSPQPRCRAGWFLKWGAGTGSLGGLRTS